MKTSQATINFYLKTSKKLSDGSHPIMLRVCFKGFKDVSTHYSCTLRHWDKKNQCIKKGYPNFVIANYELNKLKSSIIARRDEYIRLGIDYTPAMLLKADTSKGVTSNVVESLIRSYIVEKELRGSTVTGWKSTINIINEFHPSLIISEVDEGWCKRYANWLRSERGLSEGSTRTRLGHIAAIYRYACGKGLCDMGRYPFRDWSYTQKFKLAQKIQFIHRDAIDIMKDYFLSKVISIDGERFGYIDDGYIDYQNRLFVIYFWLLGYLLQGLSPIDICLLKKSDFVVKNVNGEDWWCIDTKRQKTSVSVKVRVKKDSIYSQVMIGRLMMTPGEWFLPIMHGLSTDIDDVKAKTRVRSIFSYWLNPKLKDWWHELNDVIIKKNVEEGLSIPLIDEGCTFYSYRHSFSQTYLQSGGNVLSLATLLGRSINSISTYVQQLSEEDDLIEAVSVIN